jgi:hypothetical protein
LRSVRLDEELEARLREAARVCGKPVSTIIREAVEGYCDRVLSDRLDQRLADVIGVVRSEGGRARSTGQAFRDLMTERRKGAGS